jgi:ubiquinone/menaquinone biosynthesis C-methylase UbiE
MSGDRLHRIRRHYEARVTPQRETYDILDWSSREAQEVRFAVLLAVLRQTFAAGRELRLLDVGCGLTDLAAFLDRHRFPVRYVGADITLGVLSEARRRSPQRRLLAADVFSAPPFAAQAFDVAYCSGVFNLSLGNNNDFALAALPRLLNLAGTIAVANFLHCRCRRKHEHCHYFDPETLRAAMAQRGLSVTLIDDYLENDFTLVLRRA